VTIFGDSVAATLTWDPAARTVLAQGDRLTLDLSPCGRLTQPGCTTPPPPSVFRKVELMGRRIGPTVVVLVGYNDEPHVYMAGIDKVLTAMQRRGAKHVLWLTLRAVNEQYRLTNEVIHGASALPRVDDGARLEQLLAQSSGLVRHRRRPPERPRRRPARDLHPPDAEAARPQRPAATGLNWRAPEAGPFS
jgi:hypothetical protein